MDCIFSHQIHLHCDSALDLINYALDGIISICVCKGVWPTETDWCE